MMGGMYTGLPCDVYLLEYFRHGSSHCGALQNSSHHHLCNQDISTLPFGTPFVLFSLRAKNCMMGIISSRLLGMLSPDLR